MFKIFSDDNGGLFGVAMGSANIPDTDALTEMADAEDAFEIAMGQALRSKFENDLTMRLVLLSIIESWRCVVRTRTAAGF